MVAQVEVQVTKKIPLARARVQLLLSQRALSERSGISGPTIVSAEHGEIIRALTAQALLNALNEVRAEKGWEPWELSDIDWKIQGD